MLTEVYQNGVKAALAGLSYDQNPHEDGTAERTIWGAGWRDGASRS